MKACFAVSGVEPKARTALLRDPVAKTYWFLRIQLPMALNYWQLVVSGSRWLPLVTSLSTGSVIAVGYILFLIRSTRQKDFALWHGSQHCSPTAIYTCMIASLIGLSHVHWLVIEDSPQSYRIIAPLGATVWILLYWSIRQLSTSIIPSQQRSVCQVSITAIAAMAIFVCQKHSEELFVTSNSVAYRYLLFCLRDGLDTDQERIHMVIQGREDGMIPDYYIESFGRPPSEAHWIIKDWVNTALREVEPPSAITSITCSETLDGVPNDERTLIVDMRKLKLFRMSN